jgi:hypothetical protein
MWQRTFVSGLIGSALVALIAGCAGPSAGSAMSIPAASASDLAGTWNGQFWILAGFYYPDDGTLLLQIKEDGTFTVTMTPADASNNIAKASSWSGTVSERGRLVVFHTSKGPWDSLLRSGDILYGLANDPATGADIGIKFERAGSGA